MLRVEAVDTATRVFQYKTLNNILYPNKLLFRFQKYEPPYVPFVNYWKTRLCIFFMNVLKRKHILRHLYLFCNDYFSVSISTSRSVIFEYVNANIENELLVNHPFLIFKI